MIPRVLRGFEFPIVSRCQSCNLHPAYWTNGIFWMGEILCYACLGRTSAGVPLPSAPKPLVSSCVYKLHRSNVSWRWIWPTDNDKHAPSIPWKRVRDRSPSRCEHEQIMSSCTDNTTRMFASVSYTDTDTVETNIKLSCCTSTMPQSCFHEIRAGRGTWTVNFMVHYAGHAGRWWAAPDRNESRDSWRILQEHFWCRIRPVKSFFNMPIRELLDWTVTHLVTGSYLPAAHDTHYISYILI